MGGSAQEWSTSIADGVVAGTPVELRLVMTNFTDAPATVAYEVVIVTG